MSSPKKDVAYEFDIALVDSADTGSFKANPTIAAGDFKVSTDNGALANLATLPAVSPAGSIIVKVNLSQAEMNGDKIMVQCIDAAGAEWDDVLIFIDATTANVDDIGIAGAGLTDLAGMSAGMKAEVNAEVLDVMDVDTQDEPGQGAPGKDISHFAKTNYLYKNWRNRKHQKDDEFDLYGDDGVTIHQKAVVSDDGTDAFKEKMGTGP